MIFMMNLLECFNHLVSFCNLYRHNIVVKFYKSRLNIWRKYGSDIYDEFIEMFQSPNNIL